MAISEQKKGLRILTKNEIVLYPMHRAGPASEGAQTFQISFHKTSSFYQPLYIKTFMEKEIKVKLF